MRSKQAAEREEQQRIKNLVLNYDLREDDQNDGTPDDPLFAPIVQPSIREDRHAKRYSTGHDHFNLPLTRIEKTGRNVPRARRLNLADVDWYDKTTPRSQRVPAEERIPLSRKSSNMGKAISEKPG